MIVLLLRRVVIDHILYPLLQQRYLPRFAVTFIHPLPMLEDTSIWFEVVVNIVTGDS